MFNKNYQKVIINTNNKNTLINFLTISDIMQHVKSEQCKLGDENDHSSDDQGANSDVNHHRAPHPHIQLPYPNQHLFLNTYSDIKEELAHESKANANDCGIPIPATKPKIWSLADTAACKTPPPLHPQAGGWMSNSLQQLNNRQPSISSMMMSVGTNMNNSNNCNTIQNNMQTLGGNSLINNFACTPYSRYGGFIPGSHQGSNNIGAQNSFMSMVSQPPINQILNNHFSSAQGDQHHIAGINNQMTNMRNLHQQQSLGFPEIQTDTPPQTPPSLKHPCVASSILAVPTAHTNVTCFNNNNNNSSSATNNNLNINQNSNTGYSSTSPNPNNFVDNYSQNSPQNPGEYSHQKVVAANSLKDNTAFKPFFKR